MTHEQTGEELGFAHLSIAPKLQSIIHSAGFTTPTPIQQKAIPVAIEGRDILGIAQTGTGKTLAFSIPLIQRIAQEKGRALILLPTRELALQVDESLKAIGRAIGLKTAVLIGGMNMNIQLRALRNNPHVIVATPGRLNDHLDRKTVFLDAVHTIVLDEADLMLDMGFGPQIKTILDVIPKPRQTMLFSATMPPAMESLTSRYLVDPVRIEIARAGVTPEKITQSLQYVGKEYKNKALHEALSNHDDSAIVFVRTKHLAKKLCYDLRTLNHKAAEIHSNLSLSQRRASLDGFKSGKHRILVATDIAARGIDVANIGLVVNYDLPENPEDYIHRIGRTGRAGKTGQAISYATNAQRQLVGRIERLLNIRIPTVGDDGKKYRDTTPIAREGSYEHRPNRGGVKRTNYSQSFGHKKFQRSRQSFAR